MTIIRISHKSCSHTKHMPTGPNGNHRESLISVGAAALHVKLALLHLLFTVNSCTYVSRKHREQFDLVLLRDAYFPLDESSFMFSLCSE